MQPSETRHIHNHGGYEWVNSTLMDGACEKASFQVPMNTADCSSVDWFCTGVRESEWSEEYWEA